MVLHDALIAKERADAISTQGDGFLVLIAKERADTISTQGDGSL